MNTKLQKKVGRKHCQLLKINKDLFILTKPFS